MRMEHDPAIARQEYDALRRDREARREAARQEAICTPDFGARLDNALAHGRFLSVFIADPWGGLRWCGQVVAWFFGIMAALYLTLLLFGILSGRW